MKGLFIKDLILLKNQAKFYILFALICGLMMFVNFNPGYLIGYMTLLAMMFTFTTISYDEFENGFSFIFTLPFSRKDYVKEKYGFGIFISIAVWILFFIFLLLKSVIVKDLDMGPIIATALMYLFMIQLFCAVNLPIQLKYGAEKGRIAFIGVTAAAFAAVFGLSKITKLFGMSITEAMDQLEAINPFYFFGISACICAVAYVISYSISVKIMEKKQF
jgi:ABC-2 type transport system permease protein